MPGSCTGPRSGSSARSTPRRTTTWPANRSTWPAVAGAARTTCSRSSTAETPGWLDDLGPPLVTDETRYRRGIIYGLAAYALWGAVPLFWPLVSRAGALELLAHR